jgi:hypothetical protein
MQLRRDRVLCVPARSLEMARHFSDCKEESAGLTHSHQPCDAGDWRLAEGPFEASGDAPRWRRGAALSVCRMPVRVASLVLAGGVCGCHGPVCMPRRSSAHRAA